MPRTPRRGGAESSPAAGGNGAAPASMCTVWKCWRRGERGMLLRRDPALGTRGCAARAATARCTVAWTGSMAGDGVCAGTAGGIDPPPLEAGGAVGSAWRLLGGVGWLRARRRPPCRSGLASMLGATRTGTVCCRACRARAAAVVGAPPILDAWRNAGVSVLNTVPTSPTDSAAEEAALCPDRAESTVLLGEAGAASCAAGLAPGTPPPSPTGGDNPPSLSASSYGTTCSSSP